MAKILCESCVMSIVRTHEGSPNGLTNFWKNLTAFDEESNTHKFVRCQKQKSFVVHPKTLIECQTYTEK